MFDLLSSLLHLLALAAFVRIFLPPRYVLLNPFAMWADRLFDKLLSALASALPLSARALSALVLGMALCARAALLTRGGPPVLGIGAYAVLGFGVRSFAGWLGVAVLHFLCLWWAVVTATFVLRLLHLGRALPGYAGDLLQLVARPVPKLALWAQGLLIFGGWVAVLAVALPLSSQVVYPLAALEQVRDLAQQLGGVNLFDFGALAYPLRLLFLAGVAMLNVLSVLQSYLFLVIIMGMVAGAMHFKSVSFLMQDLSKLLTGAVPPVMLGRYNLAPILAWVLYALLATVIGGVWLVLIRVVAYVV